MDMVSNKVLENVREWPVLCKDAHNSLSDSNMMLEETRGEWLRIA
jgi:hypothetical protein